MKVKLLTFGIKWLDKLAEHRVTSVNWRQTFRLWAYADKLWSLREKEIAIGVSPAKAF